MNCLFIFLISKLVLSSCREQEESDAYSTNFLIIVLYFFMLRRIAQSIRNNKEGIAEVFLFLGVVSVAFELKTKRKELQELKGRLEARDRKPIVVEAVADIEDGDNGIRLY